MLSLSLPSLFILVAQLGTASSSEYSGTEFEPLTSSVKTDLAATSDRYSAESPEHELRNLESRSGIYCAIDGCPANSRCYDSYCGCCPYPDGCYKPDSGLLAGKWGCYATPPGIVVSYVTASNYHSTSSLLYTRTTTYSASTATYGNPTTSTLLYDTRTATYDLSTTTRTTSSIVQYTPVVTDYFSSSSSTTSDSLDTWLSYLTEETMPTSTTTRSSTYRAAQTTTTTARTSLAGVSTTEFQAGAAHNTTPWWQALTIVLWLGVLVV